MFDQREAEGTKRRHQVDTVVEGMCVGGRALSLLVSVSRRPLIALKRSGINRLVKNFELALPIIDDAFR